MRWHSVSIVLVPLDAPLVQLGGPTTSRWAHKLDTRRGTLVSWALENHWDTNFKASQGEDLLFRYRLTSQPSYAPAAASRFAMESTIPPLIIRAPGAATGTSGQFLTVAPEGVAEVQLKRAADGRGLIVHAYNLTTDPQTLSLTFPSLHPSGAWHCSPIEDDGPALPLSGDEISLPVTSRSVACARVLFDSA